MQTKLYARHPQFNWNRPTHIDVVMARSACAAMPKVLPYLDEVPRKASEIARMAGVSMQAAKTGLFQAVHEGKAKETFIRPKWASVPVSHYSKTL